MAADHSTCLLGSLEAVRCYRLAIVLQAAATGFCSKRERRRTNLTARENEKQISRSNSSLPGAALPRRNDP